ncbi:Alpha/Beta hydrolase protein [Obelidium mucronatum]|nr:Alpha/Beta hydrolase protein [Obelidium mucronatum]
MSSITLATIFGGRTLSIPVENSSIAFEDSGPTTQTSSGKIFYCLPGIGDFRHTYRFLAPKLVAAGHRVICQDLRGVGDSGTKFSGYSIEECSRDSSAVLDHLEINEPVVVVGNSLSAAASITFAAKNPNRVEKIITLGGFFRDMPNDPYFRPLTPLLFNHFWGQPVWLSAFKGFFGKPPADVEQYCAAVKAKMLSNCDHAGIIGAMIRATKEPAWALVPEIKSPVLLIMGSKDPDFKDPVAENEFVARSITERAGVKVTQKIVDGVGHYPQAEAPNDVYDAIISFISS